MVTLPTPAELANAKALQRQQQGLEERTGPEIQIEVALDLIHQLQLQVYALTKKIEGLSGAPLHPRDKRN